MSFYQDDEESSSENEQRGYAQFESEDEEMYLSDESVSDEDRLKKELQNVSFETILKAKKKLGKEQQEDSDSEGEQSEKKKRERKKNSRTKESGAASRSNKHAPIEISSKKPVTRMREVVEVKTLKARDPRFDPLSGQVKEDLFKTSYGFLFEKKEQEIKDLTQRLQVLRKRNADPDILEDLERQLQRLESQEVTRKNKDRDQEAIRKWKKEEKEKRQQGKGAFYLKKSKLKEITLKAKFDELKKDKRKLTKAIDKANLKQAQKEKKRMPGKRIP